MAGGTGGHVFPALAVARYLGNKDWEVHWLGTKAGLEAQIIPKTGIPLHFIAVQGLRKKGMLGWLLAPFMLLFALYQSIQILLKLNPQVVLGGGGFVSGPGGVAAWLLRIPLVIHEQNSIVGLTNQILSLVSHQTLESFPGSFAKGRKAIYTGNPIREELLNLPDLKERLKATTKNVGDKPIKLLVLGGSRGALAINEICPQAIALLANDKRPEIWHQTGEKHLEITQKYYEVAGIKARVEPFIEDMKAAYTWADLVLCRSGAMTIGELAVVGVGSILVPYPHAVDDHQTTNAIFLQKANAAYLISQNSLSKEKLAEILLDFSNDRNKLLYMAKSAYRLAKRDALIQVAKYCEEAGQHAF